MSKHIIVLAIIVIIFINGCVSDEQQTKAEPLETTPEEEVDVIEPIPTKSSEPLEKNTQETQSETLTDSGDFKLVYDSISTTEYLGYEQIFKESGLFEEVVNELNDEIVLPFDVYVVFGECGTPNALYDPTSKQIKMCYELIDEIAFDFAEIAEIEEERGRGIVYTLLFIFYHELGHALINIHDLPATGREEDAVDQLSTIILLEADEKGEEAVLYASSWFLSRANKIDFDESVFADEHALDAQRFYNLACWVYGKNPQTSSYLVEDGYLPEERAERCEAEYTKISNSWDTLLEPYLK